MIELIVIMLVIFAAAAVMLICAMLSDAVDFREEIEFKPVVKMEVKSSDRNNSIN